MELFNIDVIEYESLMLHISCVSGPNKQLSKITHKSLKETQQSGALVALTGFSQQNYCYANQININMYVLTQASARGENGTEPIKLRVL